MRRGGQEIILSLVTSCSDAEVPGGAALAVHAEAALCRERERESGPESILQLTTVTTSPASAAQQPQHTPHYK